MAQYDGSIRINTNINTKDLKRGETEIRNSLDRISGAAKNFARTIATAFAVREIVQFGKECLELGSDLQEVQNVVDVTFTTMAKKVNDFAKNAAISAGLSETMAKQYVGTFGAMSKSFGFAEEEAYQMSTALTQLSGDVASFYNITQDEAYTKLKSVFTGETETLKDLGVVMTQAALDQYALANGFGKTTSKMTEQEKVALRYRFVMEQLAGASGDFVRTSDGWANQVRVLKLQIESLKATIGQGFINIFTPVIKVINILLGKLATVANAFKAFTSLITGNKSSSVGGAGAGIAASGGLGDMADGYNEAAGAADNLADSTEKAAKATKDAQKAAEGYLSPLDEINKFSMDKPDAETGQGVGGAIGIGGAIADVNYGNLAEGETIVDKLSDSFQSVIDRVKELAGLFKQGFFEGLGDYKPRLEELRKDILSIGRTLRDIFTDPEVVAAANNFANQLAYSLGQIAGSLVNIGITIAQNVVGGIEKYLTQNVERIKKYIISMFDIGTEISSIIGNFSVAFAEIFSVFGGDTAQQITGDLIGIFAEVDMLISENAAKLGRDILNMITQPIIDNKDKFKSAIEGFLQFIEPITSGILTAFQTVRDAVSDVYDNHLKPLFDSIAQGVSDIVGKLLDGFNNYIVPVLKGLGERFKEIIDGPFGETIGKISNLISSVIDLLKFLWESVLMPVFSWIADNIMPILAPIVKYVGNDLLDSFEKVIEIIRNVADRLSEFIDSLKSVLGEIVDFVNGSKKSWEEMKQNTSDKWNNIKDKIKTTWDNIRKNTTDATENVRSKVKSKWEEVKQATSSSWGSIKEKIGGTWESIKTNTSSVAESIKSTMQNKWESIRTSTSSKWESIKRSVSSAWDNLQSKSNVFGNIKDKIVGAWEAVRNSTEKVWSGMARVIKTPINAIIDLLNGLISGVASAVNDVASMFNSMRVDVPSWVPGIGGRRLGFNLPTWRPGRIPRLATGTVVPPNREFMAVLGDNKREPEVVSPLSTMKQAVKEAMLEMGGNGNNGTIVIKQYLDSKQVYEAVIKNGKVRQMATGNNEFMLGTT